MNTLPLAPYWYLYLIIIASVCDKFNTHVTGYVKFKDLIYKKGMTHGGNGYLFQPWYNHRNRRHRSNTLDTCTSMTGRNNNAILFVGKFELFVRLKIANHSVIQWLFAKLMEFL